MDGKLRNEINDEDIEPPVKKRKISHGIGSSTSTSSTSSSSSSSSANPINLSSSDDSEMMESNSSPSLSSSTTQSQTLKLSIDKQKKLIGIIEQLITACQKLIDGRKQQDSLEKSSLEEIKKSLNIAILAIQRNLILLTDSELLLQKTCYVTNLQYLENISKNIEIALKEGSPINRFIISDKESFSLIPEPTRSECIIQ